MTQSYKRNSILKPKILPAKHIANDKRNHTALVACLFSASILSQQALALKPSDTPLKKRLQPAYSVDDIARQIRADHQWRILAAEPTVEDAKTLYRFKLLNKKRGRVKIIVVDPIAPNLSPLK